jgi:hypothetical protein
MSATRYRFELACPADDAALRARMAADVMDGAISVSFRREPSYFAGCRLQGEASQVVKCVATDTQELIGLGARNTLMAWVDGEPRRIGYLSDLRLARKYRAGTLIARGYRVLRALHHADPVAFYTTVIYEGNQPALSALTGGRAGLPLYAAWGRLLTPAIHLDLPVRQMPVAGVSIQRGSRERLPEIVEFLNRQMAAHQFAPVFHLNDFTGCRLAGLSAECFFLALRGGRIVATLAAWDQTAVRQTHVEKYSPWLGAIRPLYNVLARTLPLKPLPAVGQRIPYLYLACAASENGEVPVFRHLLRAAHEVLRHGPWSYAICGLHETDPRVRELLALRHIPAAGRLFVVHYPNQPPSCQPPAARVPYLEAGCL